MWMFFLLLLAFVLIVVYRSIRIIKHDETAVLETFGQYTGIRSSGFVALVPLIQSFRRFVWQFRNAEENSFKGLTADRIPLQVQRYDPKPLQCTTKDNFRVSIDLVVSFQIIDAKKAVYNMSNLFAEIEDKTETYTYDLVRRFPLHELTSAKLGEVINLTELNQTLKDCGAKFVAFRVQSIDYPKGIVDATLSIEENRLKGAAELRRVEEEHKLKRIIAQSLLEEQITSNERELEMAKHKNELKIQSARADAEARKLQFEVEKMNWEFLGSTAQLIPLAIAKEQTAAAVALGKSENGKKVIIMADNSAMKGLGSLPILKTLTK